jgi:hypothetical protein
MAEIQAIEYKYITFLISVLRKKYNKDNNKQERGKYEI